VVYLSPTLTLRPCTALVATLEAALAIRHGDREKGVGHIRVGLLRHVGALARRRLVAAVTARLVVLVERVGEHRRLQ